MIEVKQNETLKGKMEFDVIVNGECKERVSKGLLAYEDVERNGLAVIGNGNPTFMIKVISGLVKHLVDSESHMALLLLMVELEGILKDSKEK